MTPASDIDAIVELAEAETGISRPDSKLRFCVQPDKRRARIWSDEEREFLRENYGKITEAEMAKELHRTPVAVHIYITRNLHLCAPSKDPRLLTAEHVAMGLGADGKSIHRLMDDGRMPGRRLPGDDVTRIIDRVLFLRWLVDPLNWIYFKIDHVGAMRPRGKRTLSPVYDFVFWEDARELVLKARDRWDDEWMTPRQAAEAVGIKRRKGPAHNVNKAILIGNLKATRWGNWRIRRSDLPPKGMTINTDGRIVTAGSIGRMRCSKCDRLGHNRLTCKGDHTNG